MNTELRAVDIQRIWDIPPDTWQSLRKRDLLSMTKKQRYPAHKMKTTFNVIQATMYGVQWVLHRKFRLPMPVASMMASEAGGLVKHFLESGQARSAECLLYCVRPDPSRGSWMKVNSSMSKDEIDRELGVYWFPIDLMTFLDDVERFVASMGRREKADGN